MLGGRRALHQALWHGSGCWPKRNGVRVTGSVTAVSCTYLRAVKEKIMAAVVKSLEPPSSPLAAGPACIVCGSRRVLLDEVLEVGVLGLAQCARCDYRWTWRPQRPLIVLRAVREVRQVA